MSVLHKRIVVEPSHLRAWLLIVLIVLLFKLRVSSNSRSLYRTDIT
nr:MAG TPA: hypothetical protein [Crassvirales sp.]